MIYKCSIDLRFNQLNIVSQESHDTALRIYIHCLYRQYNLKRVTLMCDLLEKMVEDSVLSAK